MLLHTKSNPFRFKTAFFSTKNAAFSAGKSSKETL